MFNKYDAYKDSGVEALGEIPNDWEVLRFRDICDFEPYRVCRRLFYLS